MREDAGEYLPPLSLNNKEFRRILSQMGWSDPVKNGL
jgi:hypothetical protein